MLIDSIGSSATDNTFDTLVRHPNLLRQWMPFTAALEGAGLRLRPILMTSFAFILGSVPLWTASGAGAVGCQIRGTMVIGGMLAASAIGIFFIPAIFYLVQGKRIRSSSTCSRRIERSASAGRLI